MKTVRRKLTFTPDERALIAKCTQVLGIKFEEFVHDAAMSSVEEVLSLNDEVFRINKMKERNAATI